MASHALARCRVSFRPSPRCPFCSLPISAAAAHLASLPVCAAQPLQNRLQSRCPQRQRIAPRPWTTQTRAGTLKHQQTASMCLYLPQDCLFRTGLDHGDPSQGRPGTAVPPTRMRICGKRCPVLVLHGLPPPSQPCCARGPLTMQTQPVHRE